jgi:short subunit fatty acids transporter
VAIVAVSPLVLAVLKGMLQPMLLRPVLGTPVGGLSWVVACGLGLVGGLLFARGLARQQDASDLEAASPVRRSLGLVLAVLPPLGLCIAPAVMLLLAGPAYATSLAHQESVGTRAVTTLHSAAFDFVGQLRRNMPRQLPSAPSPSPQW